MAVLIILSVGRPYLLARCLIPSAPALAVLTAVGAVAIDRWLRGLGGDDTRRWVGPAAGVLLVTLAVGQIALARDPGTGWDRAAATVASQSRQGDGLYFSLAFHRHPFEAAWRDVDRPDAEPPTVDPPPPLGEVRRIEAGASAAVVTSRASSFERLWVVHANTESNGDVPLRWALDWPVITERYRPVDRWSYEGSIDVVLLKRR